MIPVWQPELSKGDQLVEINKVSDYLHHKRLTLLEIMEDMHRADPNFHLVLFADQFEELYTPNQNDDDRRRFLDEFLATSGGQTSVCKIILTLRADFLGKALAYRPFADALQDADIKLGPMNAAGIRPHRTLESSGQRRVNPCHLRNHRRRGTGIGLVC
jgi:hypothetical protein